MADTTRGAVPLPARTRTARFRAAVAAREAAPVDPHAGDVHPVWPEFIRQANESEVAAAARQRSSRKGGGRRG